MPIRDDYPEGRYAARVTVSLHRELAEALDAARGDLLRPKFVMTVLAQDPGIRNAIAWNRARHHGRRVRCYKCGTEMTPAEAALESGLYLP